MNIEKDKILDDLRENIKKIITLYEACKSQVIELEEENINLKNELTECKTRLNEMEVKYESLNLAKTVTATSVDTHDAKIKINRLVREIDNCIALLNR